MDLFMVTTGHPHQLPLAAGSYAALEQQIIHVCFNVYSIFKYIQIYSNISYTKIYVLHRFWLREIHRPKTTLELTNRPVLFGIPVVRITMVPSFLGYPLGDPLGTQIFRSQTQKRLVVVKMCSFSTASYLWCRCERVASTLTSDFTQTLKLNDFSQMNQLMN